MIELTTLRGEKYFFDVSRIMEIRKIPETLIALLDGNNILVKESLEDILEKIQAHATRRWA